MRALLPADFRPDRSIRRPVAILPPARRASTTAALVAYPPVTPRTRWSARNLSANCAISRPPRAPRGCPRRTRGFRSISIRRRSPASNSSRSSTPFTIPSPPSRLTSTSTIRAWWSIPRRPGPARAAIHAPIRAAQPAARADALVSHAGGSSAPCRIRSTSRSTACASPSTPATSAAPGRRWRNAAPATTAARRCRKATST